MDAEGNRGWAGRRLSREAADELVLASIEILDGLPDAVVAAASDGRIVYVNQAAEELFGYPPEELLGQPVWTLWPQRVRERYRRNMELYFATEHPMRFSSDARGRRRDGSEFMGEMSWGIVQTSVGPLLLAVGRDVSARRVTESRLRALGEMGERALAGVDLEDLAAEAVDLICSSLPVTGAEVRLAGGATFVRSGEVSAAPLGLSIGNGDELRLEPKRDLSDEEMGFVRAVAHILSTALARQRGEERMRHDAVHDPLTGLANRVLFRDHLLQALARAKRRGIASGLLFVDLDNFKRVNDAYGHATGDAVLAELGARLRTAVRPADTVARLGGDEFVVLCEDVEEASAVALARRLQEAIEVPFSAGGAEHGLTASIGIALGFADPDGLLGNADTAAYRAKAHGRGRVEVFH
jgi:diguanylate cyclase (GGDEF)-like protein/PAS domain S-box-containing protein